MTKPKFFHESSKPKASSISQLFFNRTRVGRFIVIMVVDDTLINTTYSLINLKSSSLIKTSLQSYLANNTHATVKNNHNFFLHHHNNKELPTDFLQNIVVTKGNHLFSINISSYKKHWDPTKYQETPLVLVNNFPPTILSLSRANLQISKQCVFTFVEIDQEYH